MSENSFRAVRVLSERLNSVELKHRCGVGKTIGAFFENGVRDDRANMVGG